LTVQDAVLDRLTDVFGLDARDARQVGDRPSYPQDFVVGTCRESQLIDSGPQQISGGGMQLTVFSQLKGIHLRIHRCGLLVLRLAKPVSLNFSGDLNHRTHFPAAGTLCLTCQLIKGKRGNFDLDIDAIQQGTRNLRQIAFDLLRRALAITSRMSSKSTGTGVVYIPATKLFDLPLSKTATAHLLAARYL
tara:strand:+ start:920 stop:1489 length:570 start_codon:yes stop_codon:yes gene_type:complete